MVKERDAIDTIMGYYYQFDYYILQLIGLTNENDTVMSKVLKMLTFLKKMG